MDPEQTEVIDETKPNEGNEPEGGNEGGGNADLEAQIEALQKQLENAKANSRKWEKRAKSNVDETVAELRAELDAMKSEAKRTALVDTVATELGVPREVLGRMTGDDETAIRANAALLQGIKPTETKPAPKPTVPDGGEAKAPGITREQIEAIKDPIKRIHAIAANRELFQ